MYSSPIKTFPHWYLNYKMPDYNNDNCGMYYVWPIIVSTRLLLNCKYHGPVARLLITLYMVIEELL